MAWMKRCAPRPSVRRRNPVYNPPAFREDRTEILHGAIRAAGLAILVTTGPDGLIASHIPLLLDPEAGKFGTLYGHVARANPQARATGQALAIFQQRLTHVP